MDPLVRAYDFHRREFNIEGNGFLQLFKELLSDPGCSILECSARISRNDIHAARFRLGYEQKEVQHGLEEVQRFLRKVAEFKDVFLNHALLYQILDHRIDLTRVTALGIGLDCREKAKDSKVKCYLRIRGYAEKVDQVLSLHMPVDNIRDYLIHDEFMFGVDMYFDGRTGVEIYPFLDPQDLKSPGLMGKLNLRGAVDRFIDECTLLHISFDRSGRRVLHFHPQRPTTFVRLIGNRLLSLVYSNVQILEFLLNRSYKTGPIFVNLSLVEDEIISKDIRNINLQYALTYRA